MKKVTRLGGDIKKSSTTKVLRVAAYCRVSTDSDAQLESLEAQKTHYENYIAGREDWKFAGLYFDEGISGTKKEKRPTLLQMIADCKAGKIDFVITKSISRFARNTTDCLEMVRKLLELDIPIYFEKENLNQEQRHRPAILRGRRSRRHHSEGHLPTGPRRTGPQACGPYQRERKTPLLLLQTLFCPDRFLRRVRGVLPPHPLEQPRLQIYRLALLLTA